MGDKQSVLMYRRRRNWVYVPGSQQAITSMTIAPANIGQV